MTARSSLLCSARQSFADLVAGRRASCLLLWALIFVSCFALQPTRADTVLSPLVFPRPVAPARAVSNYSDHDFLIRLAPETDREEFATQVQARFGVRPKFHERFTDYASVSLPATSPMLATRADPASVLAKLPGVERARPHLILHAHATPNDPFFKDYGDPDTEPETWLYNQYYLLDVNAEQAWDLEKGSSDTVIAIIDSGISVSHIDLAAKIVPGYDYAGDNVGWWVAPEGEETPGSQDTNPTVWDTAWGQPEDHGYDPAEHGLFSDPNFRAAWWAANYDPAIGDTVDNDPYIDSHGGVDSGVGHGTIAASMAAAVTDNAEGVAGLAWNPSLMPVRIMNAEGWGFGIDAANGIYWAVDHGADVLNLSWGFGPMYAIDPAEFDPGGEGDLVKQAIEYAHSHGVLIVASAGNADNHPDFPEYGDHEYFADGLSHAGGLDFPACLPEAISVGATNEDHLKSSFSSYADPLLGEVLDLTAPGESLITGGMWTASVWDAYDWWMDPWFFDYGYPLGEDMIRWDQAAGTSFSAPIVSGFAALLKSRYPAIDMAQFREFVQMSAQDLGELGPDDYFGYGLLDAYEGILYTDAHIPEPMTATLFIVGVGALAVKLRRRRR